MLCDAANVERSPCDGEQQPALRKTRARSNAGRRKRATPDHRCRTLPGHGPRATARALSNGRPSSNSSRTRATPAIDAARAWGRRPGARAGTAHGPCHRTRSPSRAARPPRGSVGPPGHVHRLRVARAVLRGARGIGGPWRCTGARAVRSRAVNRAGGPANMSGGSTGSVIELLWLASDSPRAEQLADPSNTGPPMSCALREHAAIRRARPRDMIGNSTGCAPPVLRDICKRLFK